MVREAAFEAVYQIADQWRNRCLLDDKSLLWPEEITWTVENIARSVALLSARREDERREAATFFRTRLIGEKPAVARLIADAVGIWQLSVGWMKPATRIGTVEAIASAVEEADEPDVETLRAAYSSGFLATDPSNHPTRRYQQLQTMLEFARRVHQGAVSLSDPQSCKNVLTEVAKGTVYGLDAPNLLLHLLFPDEFEAITLNSTKQKIIDRFSRFSDHATDPDEALLRIRAHLSYELGRTDWTYHDEDVRPLWDKPIAVETQYWKIAPGENGKQWGWFKDAGLIAVSWKGSPDLGTLGTDKSQFVEQLTNDPSMQKMGYNLGYAGDQLWMFSNEMRIGDIVVAYGSTRVHGWGVITGDYVHREGIENRFEHQRSVDWTSLESVSLDFLPPELQKKLTRTVTISRLTEKEFETIRDGGDSGSTPTLPELLHFSQSQIDEISQLIEAKRQLVFEGPPGSGKTYLADLLARHLTSNPLTGEHNEQIEIVQFHQSYGYEDFVQGIRPVTDEQGRLQYRVTPGIFLQLCERARANPEKTFVLIIDEINRGNLSRIFGELLMLLEYRDRRVRLPYSTGEQPSFLQIPPNLYLIGTMNSTDRSLAMIDYALRRRFYFYRLQPVVDGQASVLARWLERQPAFTPVERHSVLRYFIELNERISRQLTADFQVGHSYFMDPAINRPEMLERVWKHALRPLLEEYFHASRARRDEIESYAPTELRSAQGRDDAQPPFDPRDDDTEA